MNGSVALPFSLTRSHDVVGSDEVTTTDETIDGLLRVERDRLVVQWRVRREISRVGREIRTDKEMEPVREASIPLTHVAGATVRQSGWGWFRTTQVTLTAADLRAFEQIAGAAGLQLAHPATLQLSVPQSEQLAAREFAAELNVRIAEQALSGPAPTPPGISGGRKALPQQQPDD